MINTFVLILFIVLPALCLKSISGNILICNSKSHTTPYNDTGSRSNAYVTVDLSENTNSGSDADVTIDISEYDISEYIDNESDISNVYNPDADTTDETELSQTQQKKIIQDTIKRITNSSRGEGRTKKHGNHVNKDYTIKMSKFVDNVISAEQIHPPKARKIAFENTKTDATEFINYLNEHGRGWGDDDDKSKPQRAERIELMKNLLLQFSKELRDVVSTVL